VEADFNFFYDAATGGRADHWNLLDATSTDAIREQRAVYERRVVGFLDRALGALARARAAGPRAWRSRARRPPRR
jgi:hypothetical protein